MQAISVKHGKVVASHGGPLPLFLSHHFFLHTPEKLMLWLAVLPQASFSKIWQVLHAWQEFSESHKKGWSHSKMTWVKENEMGRRVRFSEWRKLAGKVDKRQLQALAETPSYTPCWFIIASFRCLRARQSWRLVLVKWFCFSFILGCRSACFSSVSSQLHIVLFFCGLTRHFHAGHLHRSLRACNI